MNCHKSNFITPENTILVTKRTKFHPEDSQKMQHLPSQKQQKLQVPRLTSATKLSHQLSTSAVRIDELTIQDIFSSIPTPQNNPNLHTSFRLLHHVCSTPGTCDLSNSRTISTRVSPFLRGKIRSNNSFTG